MLPLLIIFIIRGIVSFFDFLVYRLFGFRILSPRQWRTSPSIMSSSTTVHDELELYLQTIFESYDSSSNLSSAHIPKRPKLSDDGVNEKKFVGDSTSTFQLGVDPFPEDEISEKQLDALVKTLSMESSKDKKVQPRIPVSLKTKYELFTMQNFQKRSCLVIEELSSLVKKASAGKRKKNNENNDSDNGGETVPALQGKALRELLRCPISQGTLCDAITLKCGHSFSRISLARCLDHQTTCPLCRMEMGKGYVSLFKLNFKLNQVVRLIDGRKDTERRATEHAEEYCDSPESGKDRKSLGDHLEVSDEETGVRTDDLNIGGRSRSSSSVLHSASQNSDVDQPWVPIFVCSFVLPGQKFPLHVFEPRYRLMLRRAYESERRTIGMAPHIRGPNPYPDMGTELLIQDINMQSDGRMFVNCTGHRTFKVVERGMRDGYHIAKVQYCYDPTKADLFNCDYQGTPQAIIDEIKNVISSAARIAQTCPEYSTVESIPKTAKEICPSLLGHSALSADTSRTLTANNAVDDQNSCVGSSAQKSQEVTEAANDGPSTEEVVTVQSQSSSSVAPVEMSRSIKDICRDLNNAYHKCSGRHLKPPSCEWTVHILNEMVTKSYRALKETLREPYLVFDMHNISNHHLRAKVASFFLYLYAWKFETKPLFSAEAMHMRHLISNCPQS